MATDSTAMQPGSIVVHGEVLNAGSLARDLGLDAKAPLADVLGAGWQRWSVDLFARLDGVFGLVLNEGTSTVLYRDPSGVSQLYWRQAAGQAPRVATCLRALFDTHDDPPRLRRQALHEYLRFLDIAAPQTIFEAVHAVEAGQWVRIPAQGTAESGRPRAMGVGTPVEHFSEAVNELEQRLRASIQARLAGSTRTAVFLSGGIDSSLICALAAKVRPELTSVTVGFDGNAFDETPIAEQVAAHLGVAHRVLRFSRRDYLNAFERLSQQMDQPMADPATMATVLAFDHCRDHFDAVLDGVGADEAVGAMPPRHVRLAVGYASLLPGWVRRGLAGGLRRLPGLGKYTPVLDFEHPADTMIRWHGYTRTEIEDLGNEPVSFEHTQFYRTFARFPRHAHFERFSALMNAMPCDRMGQAALVSGFQAAYPFFDRELDTFIRQLRTDWRHLPGQPKRILRALLARYVPQQLWDVPKHGFNFPLQAFLAGDDYALVRRYLVRGEWLDRGLLRADVVRRYAQDFIAGDERQMFRVWALVVLGAWLEKHDECH